MLDTLKYAESLRAAGVTEQQAAAHAEALKEAAQEGLATKTDIAEAKADLKADIADLKAENRFQRWGVSILVAAVLAVLWQLFAISKEVATLSAMIERLAQ